MWHRLPFAQYQAVWNKSRTQHSISQILLQNPTNYSLGDVQKFCYHSWCDSTIIFDQINNSSGVYFGLSRFLLSFLMRFDDHVWPNQQQQRCLPQFESILDGRLSSHFLPAPFRLKIENTTYKRLIGSQPHCHKPFAPIPLFLSQTDRLWFPPSMTYIENWFCKTSYNAYVVENKQTKLGVWTDVGW